MPSWIDIRQNVRSLIRGDNRTKPQGVWIVLRMYREGHYSEYWNESRQEAIGGAKWLYDDFLIRSITKPGNIVSKSGSASSTPPVVASEPIIKIMGWDDPGTNVFTVEFMPDVFPREPHEGDRVFTISEYSGAKRPEPPLHAGSQHIVLAAVPEHGDYGRAEIYYLFTRKQAGVS